MTDATSGVESASPTNPNFLVAVNDVPSSTYGYHDQGLGLCNYIAPGSLAAYPNNKQNPNKITNYDNNHQLAPGATPVYSVNFIQVNITANPSMQFMVTGDEFGNEFFAFYCSSTPGRLGTTASNRVYGPTSFDIWITPTLPTSGCEYVSVTPYTQVNGSPSTYCPHTAILVNFKIPCATSRRLLRGADE